MQKNFLYILFVVILFSGCTSNTPQVPIVDAEGKVYSYCKLDTYTDIQAPIHESTRFSQKNGFNWSKIYNDLHSISANVIQYKLSGKIEIPDSITTEEVYVTFGKNVSFSKSARLPLNDADKIMEVKAKKHTQFELYTTVNGKKLTLYSILSKVKIDSFSKRYVDFEIVFNIKFLQDSGDIKYARKNAHSIVHKHLSKELNSIIIGVAANSRLSNSKFMIPRIYMIGDTKKMN